MTRLVRALVHVIVAALLAGCAASTPSTSAPGTSTSPAAQASVSPAGESPSSAGSCAKQGGTLVFGATADPSTLDAVSAADSETNRIVRQMYEGLVRLKAGSASELEPLLAKSWEISQDGLTYTFHLQDGVKFQDGTPLDPEAAVYNVLRWKNLPEPFQGLDYYVRALLGGYGDDSNIESATASGPLDFEIKLKAPKSNFLISLILPTFMMQSPTALKAHKADLGPDPANDYGQRAPTGTGPFKFSGDFVAGDHYKVDRNPDYWNTGAAGCLDSIVFRTVSDPTQRVTQMLSGDLDMADLIPASLLGQLAGQSSVEVLQREPLVVGWVGMNQRQKPFDDLKVRQAVAYAIDRQAIVDAFFPEIGKPADSDFLPSFDAYEAGAYPGTTDVEKAKSLLAGSSCPPPCSIDFWYPDAVSRPYMVDPKGEFEAIRPMLEAAGFAVSPNHIKWGDYLTAEADGQYPIWLIGGVYDYADAAAQISVNFAQSLAPCGGKTPTEPTNCEYGEENDQANQLMSEALATTDAAKATDLWKQAEKLFGADVPKAPMVWAGSAIAKAAGVNGFVASPAQAEYFQTVSK